MDALVKRLAVGKHPVVARRVISALDLKTSIDRGYVLLKFTDTEGGTELGLRLDENLTMVRDANFSEATGIVHLVGHLTLDYVRIQCIADIDLSSLQGQGYIEIQE